MYKEKFLPYLVFSTIDNSPKVATIVRNDYDFASTLALPNDTVLGNVNLIISVNY